MLSFLSLSFSTLASSTGQSSSLEYQLKMNAYVAAKRDSCAEYLTDSSPPPDADGKKCNISMTAL